MKFYSQKEIARIFSTAEAVLLKLIGVCQTEKKGGYLALYQIDPFCESQLLCMAKIGWIDAVPDPEYGCKANKYRTYAENKCKHIICSWRRGNPVITSAQTEFAIKGGIRINDSLVLAFSGFDQDQDEALVVATVQSLKDELAGVLTGDGELVPLKTFRIGCKNPLLYDGLFRRLLV